MKRRSLGWIFKRHEPWYKGATYYIGYCVDEIKDGHKFRRKVREAVGPKKSEATARLAQRLRDLDDGKWQHPTTPLIFDDLLALVKADWRNNGRKSTLMLPDAKTETSGIRRLRKAFGRIEVASITARELDRYATERIEQTTLARRARDPDDPEAETAGISTARNELNVLKHGMKLAVAKDLLTKVPTFPTLTPTNVRTGFFERHELDAILAELPELVRPLALFMYWTGWRRNEVLSRGWPHVDLKAGVIRLEPGETKNGKGRDFPFALVPELKAVIERQRAYTDAVERRTGQIVPVVFHREGRPIKSFRSAWRAASRRSGITRIPHDFRRTAVRNLVRAGVSQKVAMELTGHLTPSVFDRYNITDDRDRREAVAKLAAAAQDKQVLPLKGRAARG